MAMSELLPGMGIPAALMNLQNQLPVFASHDVVPFRFTPNLQHFIGDCFTEGILISAMMAMGHALSEPQVKDVARESMWFLLTFFTLPAERRWGPTVPLCQRRDDYLAASAKPNVDGGSGFPSKCSSKHRHHHEKGGNDGVQN